MHLSEPKALRSSYFALFADDGAPAGMGGGGGDSSMVSAESVDGNQLFQKLEGSDPGTFGGPPADPSEDKQAPAQSDPQPSDGGSLADPDLAAAGEVTNDPAPAPAPAAAPKADDAPTWVQKFVESNERRQLAIEKQYQEQIERQTLVLEEQRARMQQQQAQQQQAQQRQQREAQRPRMPDPAVATPQEMFQWAQRNAAYEAHWAAADARSEGQQRMDRLENMIQQYQQAADQARLREVSERNDRFIDDTVGQFANSPQHAWMKEPEMQNDFIAYWWAQNQLDGKAVDPNVVMQRYTSRAHKMLGTAGRVATREAGKTLTNQQRSEQAKRGDGPTLRGGGAGGPKDRRKEADDEAFSQFENTSWIAALPRRNNH